MQTLAQLQSAHDSAILTAAHCRKLQYTDPDPTKRETYERFANNAARKATALRQQMHLMRK